MTAMIIRALTAIALVAAFAFSSAQAQTVAVAGIISGVDGSVIVVKQRDGNEAKVKLADNVTVSGVVRKTIEDIKPGIFIGVGAIPQADGSQRAVRISIFAAPNNEGFTPWAGAPQGTMTNAAVSESVKSVDGQVLTMKYKDGEKKIVVTPEAQITTNVPGDKSELKTGANVRISAATKKPDGTFEASRVSVGRDGVVPQ
jgi:outer membrane lipoprotein SlyB